MSGEKEWRSAWAQMASRIDWRFWAAKQAGSERFVMMSVLEGSEGVVRAGRSERSIERFGEWRRLMPFVGMRDAMSVDMMMLVCGEDRGEKIARWLGGSWNMNLDEQCRLRSKFDDAGGGGWKIESRATITVEPGRTAPPGRPVVGGLGRGGELSLPTGYCRGHAATLRRRAVLPDKENRTILQVKRPLQDLAPSHFRTQYAGLPRSPRTCRPPAMRPPPSARFNPHTGRIQPQTVAKSLS